MEKVYLSLGSNLEDPKEQLRMAIGYLEKLSLSQVANVSSFYQTKPMGPVNQPDFINAVVELNTQLDPLQLLDCCQAIEASQGRIRSAERFGPRKIDIDILLYGNEIIEHERLMIPHYGLKERPFVLYPLTEIAAELILPTGEVLVDITAESDSS